MMAQKRTVKKAEQAPIPEKEVVAPEAPVEVTRKAKIKPQLTKETRALLEKRRMRYEKQPAFRRGEWFRYLKLGIMWRRPRATTNKMRLNRKYRAPKVRIGYGKPSAVRGLHPSGFREVLVHHIDQLESIDPKVQAARIGSTVGTRKRRMLVQAADSKGIRVLNRGLL
jgi:large subunit ribosomal protein L32e